MSHQIKFDAKSSIRWGSKVKGGRVVDDFISFVDFVPTFLEIVGIEPACDMTGRSFLPVLLSQKSGIVDASRDHVTTAYTKEPLAIPVRMVHTYEGD